MISAHLAHGMNVRDGGRSTTDRLVPYMTRAGYLAREHDYGLFGLLQVYRLNNAVAREIATVVQPGDIGIGHSNGCAILAAAADLGAPFAGLVYINPALDSRRAIAPQLRWLHVWHNRFDLPVKIAKILRHAALGDMGARGYTGGDARARNFDYTPQVPAFGEEVDVLEAHSLFFRQIAKWAPRMIREIERERAAAA